MFAAEFEPMKIPARRRSKRTEVKVEADYEGDGWPARCAAFSTFRPTAPGWKPIPSCAAG
jgi:hypothetical protein